MHEGLQNITHNLMKERTDKKPWVKPEIVSVQFNETQGGNPLTTGESFGYDS